MAWSYEIRGSENRLVEIRSGFASERQARDAGDRAKRMIDCVCYPNFEKLSLVVTENGTHSAEASAAEIRLRPENSNLGLELKYSWQQLIIDAFMERHSENLPRKIAVAECALSRRLLDPTPFQLDERLAIGEALLALRRLLRELADAVSADNTESREDIA
jgi:hypothetical protein